MRRMIIILLLLILTLSAALPAALAGETEQKVVRVGWFESSFCYWDQFGRRCGIDYEYQHKISAYTGWTYEYVEDSWPNLLQMLMRGEIDLLSDVSYKPEREEYLLYPDLPMGTESYYIYANAENREISAKDLSSLNGKRIGVNQGSVQEGFLQEWADRNGVSLEIVPLVTEEDESFDMVRRGKLDGYTAIYSINYEEGTVPLCRIGASDYFYAVNKSRPDLLAELNMALAGIRDEDPYFNEKLSEERQFNTRTEAYLTVDQEGWIAEHGVVRVGYLESYLPFCQTDPETGELTGALKDFLAHAANHLSGASVRFETKPYPTVAAALEAMKTGEIDCAFPVYLSDYDADQLDVRLTSP
ncbi:MAG: transporter substrate-binding domain-containing protein, partial [Oscillospiraceae bacterium]|nr:transporter substrate-binding domain-containing protein [Oscillospiraceae bacterium]